MFVTFESAFLFRVIVHLVRVSLLWRVLAMGLSICLASPDACLRRPLAGRRGGDAPAALVPASAALVREPVVTLHTVLELALVDFTPAWT